MQTKLTGPGKVNRDLARGAVAPHHVEPPQPVPGGEREEGEREARKREGEADKRLRAPRPPHTANTVGYIVGE